MKGSTLATVEILFALSMLLPGTWGASLKRLSSILYGTHGMKMSIS